MLDAEKVEELLADQWDVVVFGAGADSPESNDPDDVVKWSDRLIKVFLTLVKIIQRKPSYAKKLFVLTTDTHSNESKTWNEAGVGLVAASHLFGMCNTCRLELPSTPIHYVDCEYRVDDDFNINNNQQQRKITQRLLIFRHPSFFLFSFFDIMKHCREAGLSENMKKQNF